MKFLAAFICIAGFAGAQNQPCSASQLGEATHVFACQGLTKLQSEKVLRLLNKTVGDQIDLGLVLEKLDELPKSVNAPLQFTERQKADLITTANLAPGARVVVRHMKDDAAGAQTAKELIAALAAGHWVTPEGSSLDSAGEYVPTKKVVGFRVGVNETDYEEKTIPNGAIPLSLSLDAMGFVAALYTDPDIPRGTIRLIVGQKQ